ncbi:DUF4127 family protein [Radiobacillus kanasensis]|uniref:DUF4127 family protein n=1 Tax=Radiobacillus kanasensis TaxID=2844358 RepID=UPI001E537E10|nr:DUF4127 family protein [Radiobacillus kanasensis]UFT98840.1 DUF4127 family protein [Radiobacillus kanasensis]
MKIKKVMDFRKFLTIVVVICLVTTTIPGDVINAKKTNQSKDAISYVPLDDRPFPLYTPKKLAEIGGFQANTPNENLLGNYFTPGKGEAIGDWLVKDSKKTSASVIAVPMLAYGGLINSRYGEVSLEEAKENLQAIKKVKEQNPDKKIYAFDVLMRLTISPTRDYPGNYAGEIREWSILKDKIENLGMNDKKLIDRYEELSESIPKELLEDYMRARKRNLAINKLMIDWVEKGIIDFLVIGQDDADPYGLHRPEHIALQERIHKLGVSDKIIIMPGADVVGSLLMTKLMMEKFDLQPKVSVEYSHVNGEDWIAPYQNIPYSQVIKNYVSILGGSIVNNHEEADIVLMANTGGVGKVKSFADQIYEYIGRGYNVTIGDDASAGRSDKELVDLLDKRIQFADVMGYSGWNVGVSITQAFTRWGLTHSVEQGNLNVLRNSAESHLELLLEALVHEEGYRNNVRTDARNLAESLGDDPQRLLTHFEEVNNFAVTNTKPYAKKWYEEHFLGENTSLGGNNEINGIITGLSNWDMYLPWNRYSELAAYPELELETTPSHKQKLVRNTPIPYDSVIALDKESHQVEVLVTNKHEQSIKTEVSLELPNGWGAFSEENSFILGPTETREVTFNIDMPLDVTPEQKYKLWSKVNYKLLNGNNKTSGLKARDVNEPFFITPKHTNLALQTEGGKATASSHFHAYTADNANDGNDTHVRSRWISNKNEENWLKITFPKPTSVNEVKIVGYRGYPIIDYKIQTLQNGNWKDTVVVTGNKRTIMEHEFEMVKTEAVRLQITNTSDGRVRIYEMEVYKK